MEIHCVFGDTGIKLLYFTLLNSCFIDQLPVLVKIKGLKKMRKLLPEIESNECVQLVVYGN